MMLSLTTMSASVNMVTGEYGTVEKTLTFLKASIISPTRTHLCSGMDEIFKSIY